MINVKYQFFMIGPTDFMTMKNKGERKKERKKEKKRKETAIPW